MKSKLIFDSFEMTNADTMGGVTYKQSLNAGTDLQYGCAAMSEVSFSFRSDNFDSGTVFEGQKFTLQMSQVESGEDDYQTIGLYTVYSVKKRGGKTSVTAYDNMMLFERDVTAYLKPLVYPITVYTVLCGICDYCGVTLVNTAVNNGDYNILNKPSVTGATCRNMISYIAEIAGCYAKITTDGKLSFETYTEKDIILNNSQYVSLWMEENPTDPINCVEVRTGYSIEYAFDTGIDEESEDRNTYVIENNPILNVIASANQVSVAESILANVKDLNYSPFDATLFRDYGINAGDVITINGKTVIVMEKTMKSGGVVLTASGNKRREVFDTNQDQAARQTVYDNYELKESLKNYVLEAELSAGITSYINSEEGNANLIAALSGEFVTQDALEGVVTESELDAKIGAYLDGAEGTASIVSAVSGKFMEKQPDAVFSTPYGATYGFSLSSDGYYTSTNTGISSSYAYGKITFNTAEATTITLECISYGESNYDYGIISTLGADLTMSSSADSSNVLKSFKGLSSITPVEITLDIPAGESYITFKYIKDGSADSFGDYFKIKVKGVEYATVSDVGASIEQTINAFEASITLSASTSGNSSTLTLKSGSTVLASADITFSGFVTFNALATSGSTTINGENITTGTISAERIDTSTLRAQKVYYYDGTSYYSIVSAELSGYNTYTHIGPKDIDNDYLQYLMLWGQPIIFASPQCDDQLSVDLLEREILPSNSGAWDIGSESYYFYNIYSRYYHLHRGGYIYETSSSLRYIDPNGTTHTLVSY